MLILHNITKRFADRLILNNLSYNFPLNKRIALIGANGAGKTTLLNIMCGLEEVDEGTINRAKSATIGYLPQEPNPNPKTNVLQECMSGAHDLYELKHQLEEVQNSMENDFSMEVFEKYEHIEK